LRQVRNAVLNVSNNGEFSHSLVYAPQGRGIMPDLAASALTGAKPGAQGTCGVTTREKSRRVDGETSCKRDAEGGCRNPEEARTTALAFVGMRAYLDGRDDHEE
jgi:hypothetical protein